MRASYKWIFALPFLATLWALPLHAQEVKRTWTLISPQGGVVAEYATQAEAVAGIKNLPTPEPAWYYAGIWNSVNQVKDTRVMEDGTVEIVYWIGRLQPSDPEWKYAASSSASEFDTEAEAIITRAAYLSAQAPNCPQASVASVGAWNWNNSNAMEGMSEFKNSIETRYYGEGTEDSPCSAVTSNLLDSLWRHRRLYCPKFTFWQDEYQACVNTISAVVRSKSINCDHDGGGAMCSTSVSRPKNEVSNCDGTVGNPCDVKSGDKYQPETDIDLGWFVFARSYHSVISTQVGGLGFGWTHSFAGRLSVENPSSVSFTDGQGFQVAFRAIGDHYVAANSSGDIIYPKPEGWALYQSNSFTLFDSQGRLTLIQKENGETLSVSYDDYQRLYLVSNENGRSVRFLYAGDGEDARISGLSLDGTPLVTYSYNALGQVNKALFPDGHSRIYHYENTSLPFNLTGVTDESVTRFSTFAYDSNNRVISSGHAGGVDQVNLNYASNGEVVVTDALDGSTTYLVQAIDGPAKIGSISNSAGTASNDFNSGSSDFKRRLNSSTNTLGAITRHTYAETTEAGVDLDVHTIDEAYSTPSQRTSVIRTVATNNRLHSVQAGGQSTEYQRNDRLQIEKIITVASSANEQREVAYSYCESADVAASGSTCPILGYLKSVDGPRTDIDDVTQYSYYPSDDAGCTTGGSCTHRKGDLWKITSALGQVTEILAYDNAGRTLSIKDANGVVTDTSYTARGWRASVKVRGSNASTEVDDRITLFEYWPTGLVKKITAPDGSWTSYSYDAAQRLSGVTDSVGNTITYTLDAAGNRLQEDTRDTSGTLKRTLSRVYDVLGQLVTQADAQANPTDFTYDAEGRLQTATDAQGQVTSRGYDPLGRLVQTLQDVGGIAAQTGFTYDALDNPTQVIDPKGLPTTYGYDGLGNRNIQTSPDTGTATYQSDSAGNRIQQTDARGIVTHYTYDALNRPTSLQAGNDDTVIYAYDTAEPVCATGETFAQGRPVRITDGSGTTQYCYSRFGDLVRKVQTTNGVSLIVQYAYGISGQLTGLTYPDGSVVAYTYNTRGQVSDIAVTPQGGSTQALLTGTTYAPFGPVTSWTYGNGRTLARAYDQNYRPTAIQDTAAGGLDLGLGYDAVGNLTTLSLSGNPTPTANLIYDALGRLTQFQDGPTATPIETYTYDATGNRMSLANATGTQAYAYPADSHRLSSMAGITRTYDAAGNTTAIGGVAREFAYNDAGRISQAKAGGVVQQAYAYNGKGEQVRRYLGTSNTYAVYDESGHWLGDYDDTGAPKQQAIWLDDAPVGLLAGPVAAVDRLKYVEPDHLGTPRVVIDPTANVAIWRWDLIGEAFGNTVPHQDPDGDGNAFVLDLRFPGQRYDASTGLNYNYFRNLDPGSGRYVESDPIGLNGGISTYAYVESNPLMYADHLGLAVYLCSRPVNVDWVPMSMRPYLRHMWVKTSTTEAGMGGECPVPGQGCADVPYSATKTKSHAGQSALPGSTCVLQQNVDEACVNSKINPGQPTGTWSMVNQCQSFSNAVIAQCRYGPQDGPLLPNTLRSRGPLGSRFSPKP